MTDASRSLSSHSSTLGPELTRALTDRGFESLTAVQTAVLDPSLDGRDLRVTSQTGSGKTVAIGLAVRSFVMQAPRSSSGRRRDESFAHPRAMVVAPTRELAKQVEEELSWLYAAARGARRVGHRRRERARRAARPLAPARRSSSARPGRLLDHLRRGAIDANAVGAVVLDEADRLLDMGFREDLEAILGFVPEGRRTHLVSATFPREVQALADATQDDPVHVEGTRLGVANADIDHVVHLVEPRQRLDALVNLLLANPDEQTLVFARTRADVATVARELADAGFPAAPALGRDGPGRAQPGARGVQERRPARARGHRRRRARHRRAGHRARRAWRAADRRRQLHPPQRPDGARGPQGHELRPGHARRAARRPCTS